MISVNDINNRISRPYVLWNGDTKMYRPEYPYTSPGANFTAWITLDTGMFK